MRYKFKGKARKVSSVSTEAEARAFCQREDSHKRDKLGNVIWFCGYTKEGGL